MSNCQHHPFIFGAGLLLAFSQLLPITAIAGALIFDLLIYGEN